MTDFMACVCFLKSSNLFEFFILFHLVDRLTDCFSVGASVWCQNLIFLLSFYTLTKPCEILS